MNVPSNSCGREFESRFNGSPFGSTHRLSRARYTFAVGLVASKLGMGTRGKKEETETLRKEQNISFYLMQ